MRLIRTIITIVIISAIFGGTPLSCEEIAERQPRAAIGQVDSNADADDLAGYYGFEEMEMIKLDRGIKGLRICDFDRDGRGDMAVVNDRKAKIELLVQKETLGPDETGATVEPNEEDINQITAPTRFRRESVAVSQKVFGFVCGDLNSDGAPDLAFYGEPKGLYVMLQKAGEAEGGKSETLNWRTRRRIEIDDGLMTSSALVCADLNNDGADDLALAGQDGVYVISQKKDGSLAEPVKYASAAQILGVEAGDLNGDNINDLILVTNDREKSVHVRFGISTGQLGPQLRFLIEKPHALQVHNVDGLAGEEILTVDAVSGRLTFYKFAAQKEEDADWPTLFYPLTVGKEHTKRDLAVSDFDGDGLLDVAISEPGAAEIILYKHTAGLGLAEPMRFPALSDITSLSVADLDNDGRAELGVLSVKEKILGLSKFENERLSFPKPIDVIGEPLAMELADVDGDGGIDCVYVSKDANNVRTLRAASYVANTGASAVRGGGAGWDETGPALKLTKLASNPDGLKVVDVDQDGLEDILIFVKYELPILVRQTQKGTFEVVDSPRAQASLIKEASLSSTAIADVDKQKGKELLLAQKNFARSLIFADGERWSIIDQYNAKSTENKISAVAAFDMGLEKTQDRPAILLLDGQKGQLQILRASEDKTYRFEKQLDVGKWNAATHLKMLFAALTGGGAKSILLFDSEKFALITPPSGDNVPHYLEQRFTYETKIKDGAYGNLVAGDINSDDRADIVMVEYKRNHIEILTLDSQNKPVPAMRFKIFEEKSYRQRTSRQGKFSVEPRELKIADVTGDGKDDLVTVIHDRIIVYPQD